MPGQKPTYLFPADKLLTDKEAFLRIPHEPSCCSGDEAQPQSLQGQNHLDTSVFTASRNSSCPGTECWDRMLGSPPQSSLYRYLN